MCIKKTKNNNSSSVQRGSSVNRNAKDSGSWNKRTTNQTATGGANRKLWMVMSQGGCGLLSDCGGVRDL